VKLVSRKTRKAIRKTVRKAISKHGPEIAAGLVGGVASAIAALASTDAPGTSGRKSNLGKMSEDVSANVFGGSSRGRDEDHEEARQGERAGPSRSR